MEREMVYDAINEERDYQDAKWGTEFDKKNTTNDWIAYLVKYLGQAMTASGSTPDKVNVHEFRKQILKVATIAVAVLEQNSYAPRHYDIVERVK